jgi:hypothetical protein
LRQSVSLPSPGTDRKPARKSTVNQRGSNDSDDGKGPKHATATFEGSLDGIAVASWLRLRSEGCLDRSITSCTLARCSLMNGEEVCARAYIHRMSFHILFSLIALISLTYFVSFFCS